MLVDDYRDLDYTKMATQADRRMPLRCEPCRERKIRYPRISSSSGGSCVTCVKRGVLGHECVFLRDVYGRRAPRPEIPAVAAVVDERREPINSELLERIRKLDIVVGSNANSDPVRPTAEISTAVIAPQRLRRYADSHIYAEPRVSRIPYQVGVRQRTIQATLFQIGVCSHKQPNG